MRRINILLICVLLSLLAVLGKSIMAEPASLSAPTITPQPTQASVSLKNEAGEYATILYPHSRLFSRGQPWAFTIYAEKHGGPITNLEPIGQSLGLVVLTHRSSGQQIGATATDQVGKSDMGPWINYTVQIPHGGEYTVHSEYKHNGHIVRADFVLDLYEK